jgi:hypothetical protein
MRMIVTSIAIGFFSAIFLSMYAEYIFSYKLPLVIIYGIIAPFLSAVALVVFILSKREEKKRDGWLEEKED